MVSHPHYCCENTHIPIAERTERGDTHGAAGELCLVPALTLERLAAMNVAENAVVDCTVSVKPTRTATTKCIASRCGRHDGIVERHSNVNEVNIDEI